MTNGTNTSHADLVWHVLAHVRPPSPQNASLYDPSYVEFCRSKLGSADERTLGEDARALGQLLHSHEILSGVQLLAWLFDASGPSEEWDATELAHFPDAGPFRYEVLRELRRVDPRAVELLRCAVALERPFHQRLPEAVRVEEEALRGRLAELCSVAPRLSRARVTCARALGRRGRALGDSIFVGLPGDEPHAPSVESAAFQAAHEAVVQEVSQAARLPFLETEHAALVVLRHRARGTDFEGGHARWLGQLDLQQFGGKEGIELVALSETARRGADRLLGVRGLPT